MHDVDGLYGGFRWGDIPNIFRDFDADEPVTSITSSDEMILEWHGYEMQIDSAVSIMERIGYIQPTDFDETYGRW